MSSNQQIVRELLRALCVLGLIFLNFAHVPSAVAAGQPSLLEVSASWCGDDQTDQPAGHQPCHACRIGAAADLPPPPLEIAAVLAVAAVYYLPARLDGTTRAAAKRTWATGPPART